ncbi:MAG: CPBP family intramembrane glutamic endopeptidase [Oscillibacter sp.]
MKQVEKAANAIKQKQKIAILCVVLLCCGTMLGIDGALHPPYFLKSVIKAALFLLCPLLYARWDRDWDWRGLFRAKRRVVLPAVALGAGVFIVILTAYFILRHLFVFGPITAMLGENAGITGKSFLWVALYISFVNSLLEEFFFRGFAFFALCRLGCRRLAYGFSAGAFALYHTAMMWGWFSLPLFLLALTGLTVGGLLFDWLNEKNGVLYPSWMVHMFANFAINAVGMVLFDLL